MNNFINKLKNREELLNSKFAAFFHLEKQV